MEKSIGYLEFSVDNDGQCENVDYFTWNGETISILNTDLNKVDRFVDRLLKLDGFDLSRHWTEVMIWWYDDNTMNITYKDYTEPELDEPVVYELTDLPSIKPDFI